MCQPGPMLQLRPTLGPPSPPLSQKSAVTLFLLPPSGVRFVLSSSSLVSLFITFVLGRLWYVVFVLSCRSLHRSRCLFSLSLNRSIACPLSLRSIDRPSFVSTSPWGVFFFVFFSADFGRFRPSDFLAVSGRFSGVSGTIGVPSTPCVHPALLFPILGNFRFWSGFGSVKREPNSEPERSSRTGTR
eukprot:COSAG01_NODE_6557_length_3610_cov_3.296212_1_plen_186_part_00